MGAAALFFCSPKGEGLDPRKMTGTITLRNGVFILF
jgi:hypothetical protein